LNPSASSSSSSPASPSANPSNNSIPTPTHTAVIIGVVMGAFIICAILSYLRQRQIRKLRGMRQQALGASPIGLLRQSYRDYRLRVTNDLPLQYDVVVGNYGTRHNPNDEVIGRYLRAEMEEQRHHGRVKKPTGLEAHDLGYRK